MAILISKTVQDTYRFPNHAHLHFLIRLRHQRAAVRKQLARMFGRAREAPAVRCEVTDGLEATSAFFAENSWAFVENVFDADFHRRLVADWPKFFYFGPIKHITKSYDIGFQWSGRRRNEPAYMAQNPIVGSLYAYLQSPEFADRVARLCGDGVARACYSIVLTKSYPGTSVIPHQDTIAEEPGGEHFVNLVFFVDGTGGEQAGGLCIMNDPDYQDVVFEPRNLSNTMLFYKSAAPIFHGFKPMRFGTHRWTVNAQFCGRDWLAEEIAATP